MREDKWKLKDKLKLKGKNQNDLNNSFISVVYVQK